MLGLWRFPAAAMGCDSRTVFIVYFPGNISNSLANRTSIQRARPERHSVEPPGAPRAKCNTVHLFATNAASGRKLIRDTAGRAIERLVLARGHRSWGDLSNAAPPSTRSMSFDYRAGRKHLSTVQSSIWQPPVWGVSPRTE